MPKGSRTNPGSDEERITLNSDGSYTSNPGAYEIKRPAPDLQNRPEPAIKKGKLSRADIPHAEEVKQINPDIPLIHNPNTPMVKATQKIIDVLDGINADTFSKKDFFKNIIATSDYKLMPPDRKLRTLTILDALATSLYAKRFIDESVNFDKYIDVGFKKSVAYEKILSDVNATDPYKISNQDIRERVSKFVGISLRTKKALIESIELNTPVRNNINNRNPNNKGIRTPNQPRI